MPALNFYSSRTTSSKTYTTTRVKEETVGGITYKYVYDADGTRLRTFDNTGDTSSDD